MIQPQCGAGWALACPSEHSGPLRPPSSSPSSPSPAHSILISPPATCSHSEGRGGPALLCSSPECRNMCLYDHAFKCALYTCLLDTSYTSGTVLGVGATPVNKINKFLPLRSLHSGQEAHSNDSSQPQGNHPTTCLAPNPELRARRWSPELRVYNLHPQIQKPEPKTQSIKPIPPSPELRAWSSESRTPSKNSESGART